MFRYDLALHLQVETWNPIQECSAEVNCSCRLEKRSKSLTHLLPFSSLVSWYHRRALQLSNFVLHPVALASAEGLQPFTRPFLLVGFRRPLKASSERQLRSVPTFHEV